ncbi:MAG: hypothetical protein PHG66_04755 [Candidatus Colwellbacteria bacterium]|nr:hypothetical protein [Candidatus Colwellbacteria bacterium]
MSDSGVILICCCMFLCILAAIGGYLYKVKGIRAGNIKTVMCAFSSTPLVGTWTSESDIATITFVSPSYTVAFKSLTGTAISSTAGSTLSGTTLTIPSIGTAVLSGTTLTLTKTAGGSIVYTKTAC